MKNLNDTQKQLIFDFLNDLNIENLTVTDHVNIEDIDFENAFDSIQEKLDDNNAFNVEILYYGPAMEYLKENDPSLRTSLEIANNLGFEPKNLSSEILASLLASENVRTEWIEKEDEINEFFQEIFDELEEENDEE